MWFLALSKPLRDGHSGTARQCHSRSQTGKSGPRGKVRAGFCLNGSDSFAQKKMFVPVYGRVLFPPLNSQDQRYFMLCAWVGSWQSRVPQAMGMGEKQIRQGCYSQRAWTFSITFPLSYLKFNTPMVWVFPFLSVEARSAAALTCTCICIFTWTLLRLQDQIFQKHFVRIEITKWKSIVNKPLFWIHGFIFQALLYILFPVRCAGDYTVFKNEIFYRLWFWLSIFAFWVHPAKVN